MNEPWLLYAVGSVVVAVINPAQLSVACGAVSVAEHWPDTPGNDATLGTGGVVSTTVTVAAQLLGAVVIRYGQGHAAVAERIRAGRRLDQRDRVTGIGIERAIVDGRVGCAIRARRNGNVVALRHRGGLLQAVSNAPMSVPSPPVAFGTAGSSKVRANPVPRWSVAEALKFLPLVNGRAAAQQRME